MPEFAQLEGSSRISSVGAWPRLLGSSHLDMDTVEEALFEEGVGEPGLGEEASVVYGAHQSAALEGDSELAGNPLDFILPANGQQIVQPIAVFVGGDERSERVAGRLSYQFAADGDSFSWEEPSMSMAQPATSLPAAKRFKPDLPIGKQPVSLIAGYFDGSAVRHITLVTNGLLDSGGKSYGEPMTQSLSGVGAMARYLKRTVTLAYPPGHGQTRATIVRRVLEQIGVPVANIAVGGSGRIYKAVELIDRPAIAFCQELLLPELLELYVDRSGVFRTRRYGRDDTAPVRLVITDAMIQAGSLQVTEVTEGPTTVIALGSKQVLRDNAEGVRTETSPPIDSYGIYAPRVAAKKQSVHALVNTGLAQPDDDLILVSRVLRIRSYRGETLLAEHTETWGWYNPLAWRYTLDATGAINPAAGNTCFIYESDAVAGDGNLAYQWQSERFVKLTATDTQHYYDERGFLTRSATTTQAWKLPRIAVKDRTVSTVTWESEDFTVGGQVLRVLGNGEAVGRIGSFTGNETFTGPSATVAPAAQRAATEYEVTDDGYIVNETESLEQWVHRKGEGFLYDDDTKSKDTADRFIVSSVVQTDYAATSEGSHVVLVREFDENGRLVGVRGPNDEDGHLPAASFSAEMVPDPAIFDDDAERAFAVAASRYEQQPMKVKVTAPFLLANREEQEERLTVEWAETPAELEAVANHMIREGCKLYVTWSGVPLWWLERGDRIMLQSRVYGYDLDLFIREGGIDEATDVTTEALSGDSYTC